MDIINHGAQPFMFKEPRQKEVYSLLRQLVGDGPASFYKDLCLLMEDDSFETSAHLAAHCMREIEGALRQVLETVSDRTARISEDATSEAESQKQQIRSCLHALGIPEDSDPAVAWLSMAGRLQRYAHRRNLSRPRQKDKEFRTMVTDMTMIMHRILRAFENHYLSVYQVLDGLICKDEPSDSDIMLLRNNIPRNYTAMKYLFENLTSPAWLPKLKAGGFFSDPPEPEFDEELQQITIQPWPQSQYLARMASLDPELVTRIIAGFPETANVWIVEDFVDAVLSMPPEKSASLIENILGWVEVKNAHGLPEKFALLSEHLVRANYVDEGLRILEHLLKIEEEIIDVPGGEGTTSRRHQPKAGFDIWHYAQILHNQVIAVAQIAGQRVVDLLSDILDSAILYLPYSDSETGEDHSCMWWQPDESQQYGYREITDVLATGVKDAAVAAVESNPDSLREFLHSLNTRKWLVFRRIALRLLDATSQLAGQIIADTLLNRDLYHNEDLEYEFYQLAEKHFQILSPSQEDQALGWIEEGPSKDEIEFLDVDDRSEYREKWILIRLNILKDYLPPTVKQRYEELLERYGIPPHLELPMVSVAWTGARSPIDADALTGMSVEDVVHYLETWEPSGEFMGPSISGLSRELTDAVGRNPSVFSTKAMRFKDLDATYIRALITGLENAVKEQKPIDWSNVLELCFWIVQQRDNASESDTELFERDQTSGPCRQAVIRLILQGLRQGDVEIPAGRREAVWKVIEILTEDPDPSREYEADHYENDPNPVFVAINSTRGQALQAVIYYVLWLRRHSFDASTGVGEVARVFPFPQEARVILEKHLLIDEEPTLALRSVYGDNMNLLVSIDPEWVTDNLGLIFPREEALKDYYDAAWNAYILYCAPYAGVFEILHEQYYTASRHIGGTTSVRHFRRNPTEALAAHSMVLYGHGESESEHFMRVWDSFWENASDSTAAYAIWFVGTDFGQTSGDVDQDIITRFVELWEHRLEVAQRDPDNHVGEMAAFGDWFVCKKFDEAWALTRLQSALTVSRKVDSDREVLERLVELSTEMPVACMKCLDAIIRGDRDPWLLSVSHESVKAILRNALNSEDAAANTCANALINYLVSQGYVVGFRDLLDP